MSSRDRSILFGLIAFNLAVKLLWLGTNELAHDEPFTVYWSQQPIASLWAMLHTENNPPLYFLLIKAWSAFVPFEAAWLRMPSAVFSALAVWPLFLLAHRLAGVRAAVVTALLFTLNNYHYGFAHEVRAYSLFTLLATTGMWLLWRAKEKPNNGQRAMLGLAMLNAVMVYSHFFGWLAIGIQALCVFALPELRHLRRNFLLGATITLACFSPYLVIFIQRMGTSVVQGTWLGAPVPEELYNMIWRWSNAPVVAVGFLAIILVALLRSRLRSSGIRLALIWAFVPLLGMYLASYAAPMFLDRYLVYAAPGFALLAALSLNALHFPPRTSTLIATVAIIGMAFTFTPWKKSVLQPTGVVATVNAWCNEDCGLEVVPRWYWLNYLAAEDPSQLKENQDDLLLSGIFVNEPGSVETASPTIVVDASGDPTRAGRSWFSSYSAVYPEVDSVEADHRVWVYRFHR